MRGKQFKISESVPKPLPRPRVINSLRWQFKKSAFFSFLESFLTMVFLLVLSLAKEAVLAGFFEITIFLAFLTAFFGAFLLALSLAEGTAFFLIVFFTVFLTAFFSFLAFFIFFII